MLKQFLYLKLIFNNIISFWTVGIFLVLLFSISFSSLENLNLNISVSAASTTFGSGNVSLDKYYLDGVNEVKSIVVAPGDYITVRLRYNNTNTFSAANTILTDSLPSSEFSYIPGSLKNCLINNQNCVTLSDSLFTGLNLETTPSVGFYGSSNNSTSGTLQAGRLRYLHLSTCSQVSGRNESFIQSSSNVSIFVPSCASISGSSSVADYSTSTTLGQRYIHQTICAYPNGEKEAYIQAVDNNNNFTPDCTLFSGSSVDSFASLDLLSNRYLHQVVCTQISGEKEIFAQSIDNSPTFTPNCNALGGSLAVESSSTIDLSSTSNAGGYIEYQMQSNIFEDSSLAVNVDIGDYGTNPTLSSTDFSAVTDSMANSLSLKVFCDTITPIGGERNLGLSDAELRTGQDFACNYQARLCPIVYDDIDSNGIYNSNIDILTSNVLVQLQSSDGIATYSTITTNNSLQCFENLAHGRNYRLNIPTPPTGDSTTGGNFQSKLINYSTSQNVVEFGYTNGSLILNVPESVFLPSIDVSSTDTFTSNDISPIQVIDTRLANPGWTLTSTVNDFVSTTNNNIIIPVANAFRNTPGSAQINYGQSTGISIGDQKTINSTTDIIPIFSSSPGASLGSYQISTNIRLTVPPFSRATSYQTQYIYTII